MGEVEAESEVLLVAEVMGHAPGAWILLLRPSRGPVEMWCREVVRESLCGAGRGSLRAA